jgi:hypothetical protein
MHLGIQKRVGGRDQKGSVGSRPGSMIVDVAFQRGVHIICSPEAEIGQWDVKYTSGSAEDQCVATQVMYIDHYSRPVSAGRRKMRKRLRTEEGLKS